MYIYIYIPYIKYQVSNIIYHIYIYIKLSFNIYHIKDHISYIIYHISYIIYAYLCSHGLKMLKASTVQLCRTSSSRARRSAAPGDFWCRPLEDKTVQVHPITGHWKDCFPVFLAYHCRRRHHHYHHHRHHQDIGYSPAVFALCQKYSQTQMVLIEANWKMYGCVS